MANLPIDLVKKLYYSEKLSAREVAEKLKVSQWVVFKFMKKQKLPRRSFLDANVVKFENQPLSFSIKEELTPKEEKLKIAGLMLYWAEGAKLSMASIKGRNYTVDVANSNPEIIELFLKFLRKICQTDENKLRIFLYCYADQDIDKIKNFWSNKTKIPLSQFTKPYIRNDFAIEKSGKMKYGLAHIRYNDKRLLLQIDKWIKEFVNNMGVSDSSNSTSL